MDFEKNKENYKAKVIKGSVNLRAEETRNSEAITIIKEGTIVSVESVSMKGWSKVIFEGKTGYVMSDFLEEI